MKILHISHFRDGSGWARAAIDQILALDASGLDVVVRCVKFTSSTPDALPSRLLELERKDAAGCDVVIQNVLPSAMERGSSARHVAAYFSEFDRLPTGWGPRLQLLDESWVPTEGAREAELRSVEDRGRKVEIVPCATDTRRFHRSYEPHAFRRELQDRFIFYTIGEGPRKNLVALARAFHLAFRPEEPVELLIKTSIPGMDAEEAKRTVERELGVVKHHTALYPTTDCYKREMVVTDRLSEHDLMRLHASCDCFVSASFGEGWNIPAFDAMAFGKTPIYTDVSGHRGFLSSDRGYPVSTTPEPVDLNDGIHDSRLTWGAVDIPEMARTMRWVYENRNSSSRGEKAACGAAHAALFSYDHVGMHMRTILERGGR